MMLVGEKELWCLCAVFFLHPSYSMASDEEAVDPCVKVTCSNHGNCVLKGGEPVCACFEGYAPDSSTGLSCLPLASTGAGYGVPRPLAGNQPGIQAEKQKEHDRWMKPRHSFGMTGGFSVAYVGEGAVLGGFSLFGDFKTSHKIYLNVEYQLLITTSNIYPDVEWPATLMCATWVAFGIKPIWMWKRIYVYPGVQILAGLFYYRRLGDYAESDDEGMNPIIGADILVGIGVRLHPYFSLFMENKVIVAWHYGYGGIFNFGMRYLF